MTLSPDQISQRGSSNTWRAGMVLAGGLCVTAGVAIWALITGSFDETSLRVIGSAVAAALATLSGLAGATALGRGDGRHPLGQATIAISGVALMLAVVLIWVPSAENSDVVARGFGISLAAMIACAHASLMSGRLRPSDGRAVLTLTKIAVGSASSAALVMSCLLLFATGTVASGFWRLLGVLVVVAVLTTLLTPLARRLEPAKISGEPQDETSANAQTRTSNIEKPSTRSLMLRRPTAG
jgi:hypothetical protein